MSDSRLPIDQSQREDQLGQRGCVLWFTGLSGAGKTTLSNEVERRVHQAGFLTARLDGDIVRDGLNSDLGFSPEDRQENLRRVTEVAKCMTLSGLIVFVAAISPYVSSRQAAKEAIGDDRFKLIYVNTPLEVCESRDPKGLYKKAREGQIADFTGISAPYEVPPTPDFIAQTNMSLDDSADRVMTYLRAQGLLPNRKDRVES